MSMNRHIHARRRRVNAPALGAAGQRARLDARLLWRSDEIELLLTRWSPAVHPISSADRSTPAVIELMFSGSFRKRSAAGSALGDPNTAVFFNSGEQFEIAHSSLEPNAGLTIRITAPAALRWLPCASGQPLSFPRTEAPIAPPVQVMARQLLHRLKAGPHDAMQVEEAIASLVSRAILALPRDRWADAAGGCWRRVAVAREYLNHAFRGHVRLRDVAAAAGCSPWHLSREFSRSTGLRMHAYLTRLRLRTALHMLADGERDLTRLALAVGFSSHSHFSAAFGREFGLQPRRFRQLLHLATSGHWSMP